MCKKDGTERLIIDFRKFNATTKKNHYSNPNFDDMLEKLSDAPYFVTLDLASGYLQMPLSKEAREKTETQTGEICRAMFGLTNAPRYFAKLIDKVLGVAQKKSTIFSFFDDIFIFGKTWEELMSRLIEILELLKAGGLTLNLKKCEFGMKKVEYLGYVIREGEIRPGE